MSTDRDEFADSRLPDLPNVGYSTKRERVLSDAMMIFIREAERDRVYLLSLVCDGRAKFRRVALNAWRHLKIDTQAIDAVFGYLCLLAGDNPHAQLETLKTMKKTPFGWTVQ